MQYSKPAISIDEQLVILQERGLIIDDINEARDTLYRVSYFRLADYWRPMEIDPNTRRFREGALFNKILMLYRFDSELKVLLFRAIQEIEIAMRTRIIHHFSLQHGAFWFMDASLFRDQTLYEQHLHILRRDLHQSNEEYIIEHFKRYDTPTMPPAWKTLEVTTFGLLSRLYSNFKIPATKHIVARSMGIMHYRILRSWMISIASLRNYCAHHARVWNRLFPVPPTVPEIMPNAWIVDFTFNPNKLYPQLCCIAYWLRSIDMQSSFVADLKRVLAKYPTIDAAAMGFPKGWLQEPLWQ